MKKIITDKEWKILSNEYSKVRYYCKCGHSVIIPHYVEKKICDWCGCYVFKNKKDEFEYRMNSLIKKER